MLVLVLCVRGDEREFERRRQRESGVWVCVRERRESERCVWVCV